MQQPIFQQNILAKRLGSLFSQRSTLAMKSRYSDITRRDFIGKSVAGVGAGLVLAAPGMLRAANADGSDKIHVGLIGMGRQGGVLLEAMSNIPGLHFQADFFKTREHFDNLMAIFDYDTAQGGVRASYQILMATSDHSGYFEKFMGTEGTIKISEQTLYSNIVRDDAAPSWESLVERGFLKMKPIPGQTRTVSSSGILAGPTDLPDPDYGLPGDLPRIQYRNGFKGVMPPHQPHLENFFAAVRGQARLNCDAREAFLSEAPVHWVNRSALRKEPIVFTPDQLSL
jgi:hypothetical protein